MKSQIEKIFQPIAIKFNPDHEQDRIMSTMIPEPLKFKEFPNELVNLQIPILKIQPMLHLQRLL